MSVQCPVDLADSVKKCPVCNTKKYRYGEYLEHEDIISVYCIKCGLEAPLKYWNYLAYIPTATQLVGNIKRIKFHKYSRGKTIFYTQKES